MRSAARPRTISSSRAGVPRNRTHRSGYSSTGNENSNFRSYHLAICVIEISLTTDARASAEDRKIVDFLRRSTKKCPATERYSEHMMALVNA